MNRRKFVKQTVATGTAFSIVPSFVLGKEHIPPSDRLYVACFGVGGRGANLVKDLSKQKNVRFVAFCDVDDKQAKATYGKHKEVKKYKDFRKVFDKHLKDIDAIVVGTPDHVHATIALPFMREKKHAYVEKPLAHHISEARMMTETAKKFKIVTQMGNHGASDDGIRVAQEYINAGIIGKVNRVDCWTNRPVWPQGGVVHLDKMAIPKELDWDLWLGPAAYRDYNSAYLPFKWRGWWDFGTGALGDMGCHIMDAPFKALKLGYPKTAQASCTSIWERDFQESTYNKACPPSSVVRLEFDSQLHGEVQLNWFDGGIMPDLPEELKEGELLGNWDGGCIFYGSKDILICDTYGLNPRLLPTDEKKNVLPPSPTLKRIKNGMDGHMKNWVDGCIKGIETSSPFSYAGPLTETVLMGNLAIRAYQDKVLQKGKKETDWAPFEYPGRKLLRWDGEKMKITNFEKAQQWVNGSYRKGWEI